MPTLTTYHSPFPQTHNQPPPIICQTHNFHFFFMIFLATRQTHKHQWNQHTHTHTHTYIDRTMLLCQNQTSLILTIPNPNLNHPQPDLNHPHTSISTLARSQPPTHSNLNLSHKNVHHLPATTVSPISTKKCQECQTKNTKNDPKMPTQKEGEERCWKKKRGARD